MWIQSYSKVYKDITKEQIWQAWSDVNSWPKWDKELEYCKMEGDFRIGQEFTLKPLGSPSVKIILSEIIPNQKFTDYCDFFGARIYDVHELDDTEHGVQITNTIKVTGILSFIWVRLVAKNIFNSIPKQMDVLVEWAKSS